MKYLMFVLMLTACGAVSAEDHALNARDAALYEAGALRCAQEHAGNCKAYLACKCELDKIYRFNSGACEGKFQDGSTC